MSEKAESHPLVKDSLSIYLLNIILTMIDFSLLRNLFQGTKSHNKNEEQQLDKPTRYNLVQSGSTIPNFLASIPEMMH